VYLLFAGIASTLVDDGKGLFLWGDKLNIFLLIAVLEKNLTC